MLPRSVLALALALATAMTSAVATATAPSIQPGVPGVSAAATSEQAPAESPDLSGQDEAPLPAGMTLEEIEVVVPAVDATGEEFRSPDLSLTQADDAVIVADQLVQDGRVESDVVETDGFQTLGVTWPQDAPVDGLDVQVRTRSEGEWTDWMVLEVGDDHPDAGTPDAESAATRGGTDPLWVGEADAVQLSFEVTEQGGPEGIELALISSEAAVTDSVVGAVIDEGMVVQNASYLTAGSTGAATVETVSTAGAPRVISRAQWGAPAQVCKPAVASRLVAAVVHHTAGSNSYSTQAQAMQQMRNDAAYHINGRGWCDIGYNFVVDKWGNLYEGRAGSMTQPVIGVHAGGFNTGTLGVSMLGTYGSPPPLATQQAVAEIIGWRLGAYGIDPRGWMSYTTAGGQNSRYTNTTVNLPRVFGHRDVAFTACPGDGGMAALPGIRNAAWAAPNPGRAKEASSVVRALYADFLGRSPDAAGLTTWTGLYVAGAGSSELVGGLTTSEEYVRLRIRNAYQEVLGRAPDAAGMAHWYNRIRSGSASVDDVKRRFYDSQEYYNRSGGTDAGYINLLYRTMFERSASASEASYWTTKMAANGRSRTVDDIWFSMEAAMYRAGLYYQAFLKRAPDRAGQENWARTLLSRGEHAVRVGIAGSEEYRLLAIKRYP